PRVADYAPLSPLLDDRTRFNHVAVDDDLNDPLAVAIWQQAIRRVAPCWWRRIGDSRSLPYSDVVVRLFRSHRRLARLRESRFEHESVRFEPGAACDDLVDGLLFRRSQSRPDPACVQVDEKQTLCALGSHPCMPSFERFEFQLRTRLVQSV